MEVTSDKLLDEWASDGAALEAAREMPDLELALLRRGVLDRDEHRQRCSRCHRTPLIGERVYVTDAGPMLCELCRCRESEPPQEAAIVHGPAFGQTLRILGQRAA